MIETTVKNVFIEGDWCSPAGRYVHTHQNVWKMRKILKQTINVSNLKASLGCTALAPDPRALCLLQHHWKLWVTSLHTFTLSSPQWDLAMSALAKTAKGRRKKQSAKEKEKNKTIKACSFVWQKPYLILSWIQRISVPVMHKNIEQIITTITASYRLSSKCKKPVKQIGVTPQRQERRQAQRSETERKKYYSPPSFTPDYCSTAEKST